jgi:hypothetical protein
MYRTTLPSNLTAPHSPRVPSVCYAQQPSLRLRKKKVKKQAPQEEKGKKVYGVQLPPHLQAKMDQGKTGEEATDEDLDRLVPPLTPLQFRQILTCTPLKPL